MSINTPTRRLLATVDARGLNTLRCGLLRQIIPTFVEEIELGRYLKKLLGSMACSAVEVAPHTGSSHVFDVFQLDPGPGTNV